MIEIKTFVFNHFEVNTYVIWDETKDCVLVDVASTTPAEFQQLSSFIEKEHLKPVALILTHPHIDHVVGVAEASKTYNLPITLHKEGDKILKLSGSYAEVCGFAPVDFSGLEFNFIKDKDLITFGNSALECRYSPGHVDGSMCFISHKGQFVISGDVLFCQSIGRTDMPTGNYDLLIKSIEENLLTLDDNYRVYCGHGNATTIGDERLKNPFLN